MNLQRIEGFYWVAKTEGYTRAAKAFPYPITQPGVHQQVKRLEQELGVRLFERVGRDRVMLTARGKMLFDAVAPFYESLPSIEATIKGQQVGGLLKIHAPGLVLRSMMPQWLKRVHSKRPDIDVRLNEIAEPDPGLVRNGSSDLMVDWLPRAGTADGLHVKELTRAHAWLVVPASGPYRSDHRLSPAELGEMPFIAYHSDRAARQLQQAALAAHGVRPREVFNAESSDTILAFVAAGLGFSLVPSLSPDGPRVVGVHASRFDRPSRSVAICAVWRKGPQPLVEAVLELFTRPPSA